MRWRLSEIPVVAEQAEAALLKKKSTKVADTMTSLLGEDGSMLGSRTSMFKRRSNEAVGCHINAVGRQTALSLCATAAGGMHSFMCACP